MDFPNRSVQELNKIESEKRATILDLNRELAVQEMKLKDSMIVGDSLSRFDSSVNIPYEKYQQKYGSVSRLSSLGENQKKTSFKKSKTLGRSFKPMELYLETVDTVFDEEGNLFSRNGSVRYLGKAEFLPGLQNNSHIHIDHASQLNKLPVNAAVEMTRLNENEEAHIIAEIQRHEELQKSQGISAPSKYFYQGKQIYPKLAGEVAVFKQEPTKRVKIVEAKQDLVVSGGFQDAGVTSKMLEDMRKKEIALQICKDLLLDYSLSMNKSGNPYQKS